MSVLYARVPNELKEKIDNFAESKEISKTDALISLLNKGLDYASVEEKSDQLKKKLVDAEEARTHLQNLLNIVVGKCTTPNCGLPITLLDFAYQRCRGGHYKTIKLDSEYEKSPGISDLLVAGLAVIGTVAAANYLLGGSSK
jgi:hypothetical protein